MMKWNEYKKSGEFITKSKILGEPIRILTAPAGDIFEAELNGERKLCYTFSVLTKFFEQFDPSTVNKMLADEPMIITLKKTTGKNGREYYDFDFVDPESGEAL